MNKLILANWKMYKTLDEIKSFADEFFKAMNNIDNNVEYGIAVPSIYLVQAKQIFKNVNIIAQDAHFKKEGAYTGNISYSQLLDCNIHGSIIGHSERRQMFNETDEIVNLKTKALLENNMQVILCIGETIEEYEANKSFDVIWSQTEKALNGIDASKLNNLVIAYEPVWAIGTGKVPTGKEVDELIAKLRNNLEKLYNKQIATNTKVLYGGSVNDKNASEFFAQKNIDGALVGSFALNPQNFAKLIQLGGK